MFFENIFLRFSLLRFVHALPCRPSNFGKRIPLMERSVLKTTLIRPLCLLALCISIFASSPTHAGQRQVSVTPSPMPLVTNATASQSASEAAPSAWPLAGVLCLLIAALVRVWRKEGVLHKAEINRYGDEIEKCNDEIDRLNALNSALKREVSVARVFADGKVDKLSDVEKELKALQSRLTRILEVNPGAEERVQAKLKAEAEARAQATRAREKRAQIKQGGVNIRALLNEMKKGY